MPINHIQQLFAYIQYAPAHIQSRYCNGIARYTYHYTDLLDDEGLPKKTAKGVIITKKHRKENPLWKQNQTTEATFNGLLFRDGRVYVINIYTFDPSSDYSMQYLEITKIFNKLLKQYNIYHLSIIIPKAIRKLYADSTATENLIPFLKYDRPYHKPKVRYKITSNHNKERKFIICQRDGSDRIWNQILYRSIAKFSNLCAFAEQRRERPQSLYFLFAQEPELRVPKHRQKPSHDLPPKRERKARRLFGAFGTETWRSDRENNPNT